MLENVLTKNNAASKTKITCKTLVSIGLIALAVVLPQLVHLAYGQSHACACKTSVYDGRACGVRGCFGLVLQQNLQKRSLGISGSACGSACRQGGFPRIGVYFPKCCALYGGNDLEPNPRRLARPCNSAYRRSAHRNRTQGNFG